MANSNLKTFFGEDIDMFWHCRESGSAGYKQVNGDKGNAMGAYQFDRRYALVPFMKYCVEFNPEKYAGFEEFIEYGAGSPSLQGNKDLAELWLSYCDNYFEEFARLQDEYAYKNYYLPAKNILVNNKVPIDNYSPVLKGSLWSFAIRSGSQSGAKKVLNAYNNGGKAEMKLLKMSYASYGNQDANRWSINSNVSQYADAIRIYKEKYNTEVKEEEKPVINYYVGTDWKDGKCVDQDNAYSSLDNAKARVDKLKGSYKVYDKSGKIIYPEQKVVVEEVKPIKKEEPKKEEVIAIKKEETPVEEKVNIIAIYPDKEAYYKVCTGWKANHTVGQVGAFTKYENAKNFAASLSKSTGISHKVYLEGVLQFTGSTK